jgi:hypothetical protein
MLLYFVWRILVGASFSHAVAANASDADTVSEAAAARTTGARDTDTVSDTLAAGRPSQPCL